MRIPPPVLRVVLPPVLRYVPVFRLGVELPHDELRDGVEVDVELLRPRLRLSPLEPEVPVDAGRELG